MNKRDKLLLKPASPNYYGVQNLHVWLFNSKKNIFPPLYSGVSQKLILGQY
jgi:hypothetical protein